MELKDNVKLGSS